MSRCTHPPSDRVRCDALHDAEEIWVYLSGGGLRSALGSLGVMFFLHEAGRTTDGCIIDKVRRVGSVSGGSVANAALVTWGVDDEAALRQIFNRVARHGTIDHYARSILAATGLVAALALTAWGAMQLDMPVAADFVAFFVFIVLGLGASQLMLGVYLSDRIRFIVGKPPPGHRPPRFHVFATADMKSGLPAHVVIAADEHEQPQTVLVHDRTSVADRLEYFEAPHISPARAARASSTWPFLGLPVIERPRALEPGKLRAFAAHDDGVEADDLIDVERAVFAMMDGGLTGTLASRLDSRLDGASDDDGVMQQIDWPRSARGGSRSVYRIVVDGGQYLGITPTWWIAMVPGLSAVNTVARSIKVSLDGQLTAARRLADDRPAIWYVGVTGHGRHHRYELRRSAPRRGDGAAGEERWPVDIVVPDAAGLLTDRSIRRRPRNTRLPVRADGKDLERGHRFGLALLEALKLRADRVSYWNPSRHATACAASAVASAHVEANGIGTNPDELVGLLRTLERAMRRTGDLDDVIWPLADEVLEHPRPVYRWSQLERLHPADAPNRVVPISHRGVRGEGVADNSTDAFVRAAADGFRVLECDVAATAPSPGAPGGELVAVHAVLGRIRRRGSLRFPRIASLSYDDLYEALGRRPDRIVDLLADDRLDGVVWNFEAKDRRCMAQLVEVVAANGCSERTIISGGWKQSCIDVAREHNPDVMTAGHLREVLLLAAGHCAPHLAVAQLPAWIPVVAAQAAKGAAQHGVQVHWFGPGARWRARRHAGTGAVGMITDTARPAREWLVKPAPATP